MIQCPSRTPPDPTRALLRAGMILCGIALTWFCAAFGLFMMTAPNPCRATPSSVQYKVDDLANAVATFQIERDRCPTTWSDLVDGAHVRARTLVDYWGTKIVFSCSAEEILVTSAGPDRRFGTGDDIVRHRR
jgi:hypothetical protein